MKECKGKGLDGAICRMREDQDFCFWLDHLRNQDPKILHKEAFAINRAKGCKRQKECFEYIRLNKTGE